MDKNNLIDKEDTLIEIEEREFTVPAHVHAYDVGGKGSI
jgi:hypothetical protein